MANPEAVMRQVRQWEIVSSFLESGKTFRAHLSCGHAVDLQEADVSPGDPVRLEALGCPTCTGHADPEAASDV